MKSNLLLAAYLVIAVLLYPFLKYYIDSADTLQYITIAKNYSAGNFADAVNSFWSPMIAWLLVPFVLFRIEPVFAFKILQVIIGVFTLRLVYYHIDRSNAEMYIRTALKAACIPLVLSFAFLFSTPDLLLLTLYIWLVTLLKNNRSPLLVGICGAALYFTKGFGFAFFIVASAAAYLYKYFSREIEKKKLISDLLKAYGIFFLLCAPWIYVISKKENKFLFSSAGSNAINLIDPKINPNPFDDIHYPFEKGILSEPPPHAISAWLYQHKLTGSEWSPFNSKDDFLHYLKTIFRNIISVGSFHFGTDAGTVLVLALLLLFIVSRAAMKTILKDNIFFLIICIACTVLYTLVYTIHRYLWINDIAIVIIFSAAVQKLFQWKPWTGFVALCVFIFLVIYAPIKSIAENINGDKDIYSSSQTLKEKYHFGGNIASLTDSLPDRNHRLSHLICYYTDSRYYGMVNEDNWYELETYKIKFVLNWNPPPGDEKKRAYLIALPGIGLLIYELHPK